MFQGTIQPGSVQGLHTVRAVSPWQECMYAAQRVRQLVSQGCRYRDITVVCTDLPAYQPLMDLVFHRFHIPLYRSGTEEILQNSVINTVLTALDAAVGGFDPKETLRYLRSALSPVDSDTCDQLENYAVIWGIRGNRWTQSWTGHPEGLSGQWDDDARKTLAWLDSVRYQAIAPLQRLQNGFREAKNLRGQVLALTAFVEDISLQQQLSRMARELDETGAPREA